MSHSTKATGSKRRSTWLRPPGPPSLPCLLSTTTLSRSLSSLSLAFVDSRQCRLKNSPYSALQTCGGDKRVILTPVVLATCSRAQSFDPSLSLPSSLPRAPSFDRLPPTSSSRLFAHPSGTAKLYIPSLQSTRIHQAHYDSNETITRTWDMVSAHSRASAGPYRPIRTATSS